MRVGVTVRSNVCVRQYVRARCYGVFLSIAASVHFQRALNTICILVRIAVRKYDKAPTRGLLKAFKLGWKRRWIKIDRKEAFLLCRTRSDL